MFDFFNKSDQNSDDEPIEEPGLKVFPNRCSRLMENDTLCHNCVANCPEEAVDIRGKVTLAKDKCNGCGICVEVCPCGVFSFGHKEEDSNISRREFFQRFMGRS